VGSNPTPSAFWDATTRTIRQVSYTWPTLAGIGTIIAYWGDCDDVLQEGEEVWAFCDGREISRSEYPELHALVGEIFGAGDNSTTFNLPDLRGRFIRGLDWGPNPIEPGGPPVTSERDKEVHQRTSMATGTVPAEPTIGSLQSHALEGHVHKLSGLMEGEAWSPGWRAFQPQGQPDEFGETSDAGGLESRPGNVYVNFIIRIA
jgi:hypothetical protein